MQKNMQKKAAAMTAAALPATTYWFELSGWTIR